MVMYTVMYMVILDGNKLMVMFIEIFENTVTLDRNNPFQAIWVTLCQPLAVCILSTML